jgi:hypothetical protein
MRYFVPKLAPGWMNDGPQSDRGDHFGGLPFGLPIERWPVCRHCGATMSFVCQLEHHAERLDLGANASTMFVFWCFKDPGNCPVWEPDAGSNAVFVLKADECTNTAAHMPEVEVLPYLPVLGWREHDDGVASEQRKAFFDATAYLELDDRGFEVLPGTRLGGAPFWPQAAPVCPWDPAWQLVLQLDGGEWLEPPAPSADELGCTVHFQRPDGSYGQREPLVPKRFAPPQGVMVTEDGAWCVDRFRDFTIYVFVQSEGDVRLGRLCMQH